jgi:hypothetical protein
MDIGQGPLPRESKALGGTQLQLGAASFVVKASYT